MKTAAVLISFLAISSFTGPSFGHPFLGDKKDPEPKSMCITTTGGKAFSYARTLTAAITEFLGESCPKVGEVKKHVCFTKCENAHRVNYKAKRFYDKNCVDKMGLPKVGVAPYVDPGVNFPACCCDCDGNKSTVLDSSDLPLYCFGSEELIEFPRLEKSGK